MSDLGEAIQRLYEFAKSEYKTAAIALDHKGIDRWWKVLEGLRAGWPEATATIDRGYSHGN